MACRDAYGAKIKDEIKKTKEVMPANFEKISNEYDGRLFFGVDSEVKSDNVLQNNLTEFEWVTRNKLYPNFWGRNINGEDCLTKEEIAFLHKKGCKIAPIYIDTDEKDTEEQGKLLAKKISLVAMELGITVGTAIFLEIEADAVITRAYMKGYAQGLLSEGYTPGFRANTDAKYGFDREYSGGMQTDKDLFEMCLIWAVAPSLSDYDGITDAHLIHPDKWSPFAPSGTTREEIAVWQYGKNCHPIKDDEGKATSFNINLIRNNQIMIKKMF